MMNPIFFGTTVDVDNLFCFATHINFSFSNFQETDNLFFRVNRETIIPNPKTTWDKNARVWRIFFLIIPCI